MGLTYVTTEITNLTEDAPAFSAQFLVDTGAIDCMAPASALRKAGIKVRGRDTYELANGQIEEYDIGLAIVKFIGHETVSKVIFGPDDCEPILGVVALESTGIGVDPTTKSLKQMGAKPLKKKTESDVK